MRLLLVEDDPLLAGSVRERLIEAGYAVDIADNGIDGEFMGEVEPYDAIVLDLGLPQRPGLDVLKHWRKKGNAVPVLVLTARDAWHEKVAGFKAGADDYLAKPFHIEELLVRLTALIRRANSQTGGTLEVAGLALDEERMSVAAGQGEKIALTGVEFRLLRYLMLHPGRILSKSQLLEHTYDYDSEKESNVVEVYINRLRKKIGKEYIVTRRGQGYIFAHDMEL